MSTPHALQGDISGYADMVARDNMPVLSSLQHGHGHGQHDLCNVSVPIYFSACHFLHLSPIYVVCIRPLFLLLSC